MDNERVHYINLNALMNYSKYFDYLILYSTTTIYVI